ncbi:hypothetical protein [Salibacterium halotolerans]|uniref:Uncharacterized protein n=1 Tax=Salibacterium halotolerans TaxID=1884432 RepID=A0A1I5Y6V7_9BACI|nr:hypothetical protein [Salibacterium halotolerans]SFQ39962.1 hypothetical protein SAMN05518683_1372 [Salibacterium halotolerans]
MQKNAGLLLFSINLLIVFGSGFVISYVRTGDFYIGQMIGTAAGIILFVPFLIWRIRNKYS